MNEEKIEYGAPSPSGIDSKALTGEIFTKQPSITAPVATAGLSVTANQSSLTTHSTQLPSADCHLKLPRTTFLAVPVTIPGTILRLDPLLRQPLSLHLLTHTEYSSMAPLTPNQGLVPDYDHSLKRLRSRRTGRNKRSASPTPLRPTKKHKYLESEDEGVKEDQLYQQLIVLAPFDPGPTEKERQAIPKASLTSKDLAPFQRIPVEVCFCH